MNRVNRRSTVVAVVCGMALLTACGGTQPTGGAADGAVTSEGASVTESPAGDTLSRGPGAFDLPDLAVGLSGLTSYRASVSIRFEGTREGQPASWSESYRLVVQGNPGGYLLVEETAGLPEELSIPGRTEAVLGGIYYVIEQPDAACTAAPVEADPAPQPPYQPALYLLPVYGAEEGAQTETLNGLTVRHFSFDERAIGAEGLSTAAGDLWIAAEGGFVVRYTLREEGGPGYFGEGTEGAMTWDYELRDANQPFDIQPPGGCPLPVPEAALLPDATVTIRQPGFARFTTATDVSGVVEFYQENLPQAGWQAEGEPMLAEGLAWIDFVQGDQRLAIQISAAGDGAGSTVSIWLETIAPTP